MLIGKMEGTISRRQRIKYMDASMAQLREGWRVVDLVELAEERTKGRSMVANVT